MFKVNELLKATGGRLISGKEDTFVKGISIDSRTLKKGEAFIAIKGDKFDGHDFIGAAIKKGAGCIICARRITHNVQRKAVFIEAQDTTKALGDIAQFHRMKFNIPVIAVTGSNGKTTTKEMIAWVLSERYRVLKNEGTKNNQIGSPMTLLKLNKNYDIAVLELGTNHFGEIKYLAKICQPNIGIIINIGPSHLEYLRDLKGVLEEKYSLIENLKKPHVVALNSDDPLLRIRLSRDIKKPFMISFGMRNIADFFASDIKDYIGGVEFLVNKKYKFTVRTLGRYYIYNALAAISIARLLGLGYKDIALRLANFDFPQGRLNLIKLNKIKFIDDTYNSNPLSLKEALGVLANFKNKGRKIFVMGDMLELGRHKKIFHSQAGKTIINFCNVLITVGKLSRLAAKTARLCGFDVKSIFTCESAQEARDILFNKILPKSDDIVLVKGSRAMKMEEVFKI